MQFLVQPTLWGVFFQPRRECVAVIFVTGGAYTPGSLCCSPWWHWHCLFLEESVLQPLVALMISTPKGECVAISGGTVGPTSKGDCAAISGGAYTQWIVCWRPWWYCWCLHPGKCKLQSQIALVVSTPRRQCVAVPHGTDGAYIQARVCCSGRWHWW